MRPLQAALSYPLPHPFPPGNVWAAIKDGVVVNMIYMRQDKYDEVPYTVFRQRSRASLAKQGVVWSGKVSGRCFVPDFKSTDHRLEK